MFLIVRCYCSLTHLPIHLFPHPLILIHIHELTYSSVCALIQVLINSFAKFLHLILLSCDFFPCLSFSLSLFVHLASFGTTFRVHYIYLDIYIYIHKKSIYIHFSTHSSYSTSLPINILPYHISINSHGTGHPGAVTFQASQGPDGRYKATSVSREPG